MVPVVVVVPVVPVAVVVPVVVGVVLAVVSVIPGGVGGKSCPGNTGGTGGIKDASITIFCVASFWLADIPLCSDVTMGAVAPEVSGDAVVVCEPAPLDGGFISEDGFGVIAGGGATEGALTLFSVALST